MSQKAGKNYIGLGVGAYIVNDKNEVLLMLRPKSIKQHRTTVGMWSVPGGQVEFAESCEQAVKREAKEELGIDIEIKKVIGCTDQILPISKAHWHCMHFLCRIKKGKPKILEAEKCEKIKWFSLNKLPKKAGIAHVVRPAYLLGKISKKEYQSRLINTPES